MSRIQKMKGLVAASLRVKALNDNPYNIFATGFRNGVVESSPYPAFKPLAQTIKQPFNTYRNGSIYFTSPETALQEIKTQLAVKSFDIHTQYVAIISALSIRTMSTIRPTMCISRSKKYSCRRKSPHRLSTKTTLTSRRSNSTFQTSQLPFSPKLTVFRGNFRASIARVI